MNQLHGEHAASAEIISAGSANFLPRPLHLHEPLPYTYRDRSIACVYRPRSLAARVRCMHDDPYHGDAGMGLAREEAVMSEQRVPGFQAIGDGDIFLVRGDGEAFEIVRESQGGGPALTCVRRESPVVVEGHRVRRSPFALDEVAA